MVSSDTVRRSGVKSDQFLVGDRNGGERHRDRDQQPDNTAEKTEDIHEHSQKQEHGETEVIVLGDGVTCLHRGPEIQPFIDDEDANKYPEGSPNRAKQLEVSKGTDTAYGFAKKYKLKTAWGTDILGDQKRAARQGAMLAKMVRWYSPGEVLTMATSTNAELLAMSGRRNPYPGKLGVVEEGALADLLLVKGDPIGDIKLVEDPDKNFLVIMKDGKIYKSTLSK